MEKLYVGIDHHKKFSQVCAMDSSGQIRWEGPISNNREDLLAVQRCLPAGAVLCSVLEAGRNWGILFDLLEELDFRPILANPLKVRMIADASIKTDKIDARALATLLRVDMIPRVHVPPKEIRDQKNVLRQRFWLVRQQTRIKNRIHDILDRNHLSVPPVSDLFGARGRTWMNALSLPDPDGRLLVAHLTLLDHIRTEIRRTESWIDEILKGHPLIPILASLPGVGKILAALMALEIHTVDRFAVPAKLMAYSGVVSSVHSSGGKTFHGPLIQSCNRHLRYAFLEASWTAVRTSPYFVAYFKRLRTRLSVHDAIVQVARKFCQITFDCLKEQRPYEERPYRFTPGRLHCTLAF